MSDKRQILVDTALTLFYDKGVNTVGINEVLSVSGIAKKTLYNHFKSKEALVLAALQQRNKSFLQWLEACLSGSLSNNDVITRLFDALTAWFSNKAKTLGDFRGCFFINTAAEFSDQKGVISSFCQDHKKQVREVIAKHLISSNQELLDSACLLKEGAITTAYVSQDLLAAEKCKHLCLRAYLL